MCQVARCVSSGSCAKLAKSADLDMMKWPISCRKFSHSNAISIVAIEIGRCEPIGRHGPYRGPCAVRVFALKQRLLTAHMSIGNKKLNALECLREDLSCGTISFFWVRP
jgi:hypothetical protein